MTNPIDDYVATLEGASDIAHLTSPVALGNYAIPGFRTREHQRVISSAVVDGFMGRGPRFIAVSVPQQEGKSLVTSVLTPLLVLEWHALGLLQGGLCGLMSYEDSLAMTWSLKIRRIIEAEPDKFYSRLRKDSRASGFWETEANSGILAIGTGGSVQGRPLTLLGLDDVTKNFDQAMSPAHQMKLWDNWTSVLYGRLQPWTVVLVTQVRWSPDDFIGRLASNEYEGDPEDWKFIRIPAICDELPDPCGRELGEPLIRPQADMTKEEALRELESVKKSVSTYAWSTLWQQSPVDPEGAIFPESKWRYWGGDSGNELPNEFDTVLMSWDMAFKDEAHHDWVVGQAWGAVDEDRYLIDQFRGHWGFTETCERVDVFAKRIRAKYPTARTVLVEDKANGTAVINVLRKKVGGLVEVTPEESKLSRAWSCQPLLLGGNLYAPAPSVHGWVREFTKELADFRGTGTGHDDQCDAMTQCLRFLMDHKFEPSVMATPDSISIPDRAPARTFTAPIPFRR